MGANNDRSVGLYSDVTSNECQMHLVRIEWRVRAKGDRDGHDAFEHECDVQHVCGCLVVGVASLYSMAWAMMNSSQESKVL